MPRTVKHLYPSKRHTYSTSRLDTSCLCNCNSPSCGGGGGGASQFAKSLFVLFGALSFISRRRTNTLLSLSTAKPISMWWSVCGASSLWLEKSLRLCDRCRLVACTPFFAVHAVDGVQHHPKRNELNAKMPSHLHKYISFKWYRQMNFRIERHPIIRMSKTRYGTQRESADGGDTCIKYNCCESKYK